MLHKNIVSTVARQDDKVPSTTALNPGVKGILQYVSNDFGEMEWLYVTPKKSDEYKFRFSKELSELFCGNFEMFYFYTRIGEATNWTGRLNKKQYSARSLSELTGYNPNICLKLRDLLINSAFAEYINHKGQNQLVFKSIKQLRSKKDYINVILNKKQTIKQGARTLQNSYIKIKIKSQMKAVECIHGSGHQSNDNERSKVTLSNAKLGVLLGCTKQHASRFKKQLKCFNFERQVITYGQPSVEEINRIVTTKTRGAFILSSTGYLKWEGAHLVSWNMKYITQPNITQ
jgi:hypothetical protein